MKRSAMIGVAVLAVLAVSVSLAAAGPGRGGRGSGGWGMGGGYQGMYNPATVESVTGTIESIDRTVPMKGMSRGVHLTLKTEKGSFPSIWGRSGSSSGSTRSWRKATPLRSRDPASRSPGVR